MKHSDERDCSEAAELSASLLGAGHVIIEAQWADKLDADVDLWGQAWRRAGRLFQQEWPDLQPAARRSGRAHDITDYYEIAYTRGTSNGEYVINIHMYRGRQAPIQSTSRSSPVKRDLTGSAKQLVATTVQLRKENQELTALRFRLDAKGGLVAGSVNSLLLGAFILLILPRAGPGEAHALGRHLRDPDCGRFPVAASRCSAVLSQSDSSGGTPRTPRC